jgi:hypothetical protein
MDGDDHLVISIKLKKFWIERLIYYAIIIGLVATVFINPLSANCDQSSTPIIETVTAPVVAAATVVTPEPEPEPEPEVVVTPDPVDEELTGNITLGIGNVETLAGNNTMKVESVFIIIDNEKELFTPKVRLYWYTSSTDADAKDRQRTEYTYPSLIPTGLTNSKKLDDELTSHYVIGYENKDTKLYVLVELLNAKDNTLIAKETKSITI